RRADDRRAGHGAGPRRRRAGPAAGLDAGGGDAAADPALAVRLAAGDPARGAVGGRGNRLCRSGGSRELLQPDRVQEAFCGSGFSRELSAAATPKTRARGFRRSYKKAKAWWAGAATPAR